MTTPLAGLKVLELARVLAGPWAGQTLADLGATVIKIEGPSGDETRTWGAPATPDGTAAYFHCCNRGKHSIALNYRDPDDLALVKELAADADVVIENFKVGGLKKFGLDYESIKATNPNVIYCSITGFGQTGPYAHRAGYDFIIQAMSGIMDLTGDPNGPPEKAGVAYSDILTGLYSVIAIQAALAARTNTGEGQHIDMALLDSQIGVLTNQASNYLMTGAEPKRLGNTHPSIVPYQVFNASDEPLVIACGNDGQFGHLSQALGVDLHVDPRFTTNPNRVKNREALSDILNDILVKIPRAEILDMMEEAGVPAGPINSVAQAFDDPQVQHRGMVVNQTVRNPIRFSDLDLAMQKRPPSLNQDNDLIRNKLWNIDN